MSLCSFYKVITFLFSFGEKETEISKDRSRDHYRFHKFPRNAENKNRK